MKWRNNPNYCVNIPGSASNVRYTLFTCNASDNDQRFRIVTVGGNQSQVRILHQLLISVIPQARCLQMLFTGKLMMQIMPLIQMGMQTTGRHIK
jgi:hypothetical protein